MRWVNAATSSRSFTARAPPGADGRSRERRVERNAADAPEICLLEAGEVGHQVGSAAAGAGPRALGGHADREQALAELVVERPRQAPPLAVRRDLLHASPVARGGRAAPA